jgi:hypothetical protein
MKMRLVLLLTVLALMVMMLAMSVAPALAGKGGVPGVSTSGSCGLSKAGVQGDIRTTGAPGASESGHADFNGCQGHG